MTRRQMRRPTYAPGVAGTGPDLDDETRVKTVMTDVIVTVVMLCALAPIATAMLVLCVWMYRGLT